MRFRYARRSAIERALRNKDVKRNGMRLLRGDIVSYGDILQIYIADELMYPPVRVLYDADGLLAVDKPAGLPSVGEGSMEEWVRALYPDAQACHRLDSATCGVILFARSAEANEEILRLFETRRVAKTYLCLVKGVPDRIECELRDYLVKDSEGARVNVSRRDAGGAQCAVLRYRVLASGEETALLEIDLVTGRTHQIRAQMANAGHPVVGDDLYGDRSFNRSFHARGLFLQSVRLELLEGRFSGVTIESPPVERLNRPR